MHRQLLVMPAGDERGERDKAPTPAVEPGTGPDLAPGVAGDEVLEVGGERRGAGDGPVDMSVAEHFTTDGHPPAVLGRLVAEVREQRGRHHLRTLDVREMRGVRDLDERRV